MKIVEKTAGGNPVILASASNEIPRGFPFKHKLL